MFGRLKNWFLEWLGKDESTQSPDLHRTGAHVAPRPKVAAQKVPRKTPEFVDTDDDLGGEVESMGPGKNVLIRNKFVREDTGTHETLKILDDSMVDSGEEEGIDPYNTGGFDRSRNWDKRFGK